MTNANALMTASGTTGGLIATLLHGAVLHRPLRDTVLSASRPWGTDRPWCDLTADVDSLRALVDHADDQVRIRARLALDLLTNGDEPASLTELAHSDLDIAADVLEILWTMMIGDTTAAPWIRCTA